MVLFTQLLVFDAGREKISLTRKHIYFYLFYLVDRSGNHEHKRPKEICTSFPLRYRIVLKTFWEFLSYHTQNILDFVHEDQLLEY